MPVKWHLCGGGGGIMGAGAGCPQTTLGAARPVRALPEAEQRPGSVPPARRCHRPAGEVTGHLACAGLQGAPARLGSSSLITPRVSSRETGHIYSLPATRGGSTFQPTDLCIN